MINRTIITGRLVRDPELRYSQNGVAVCNFTVAVNRAFSKDNEADFINCVCFKKTAENLANYQSKGNQIGVDGRLQTRNYENKQGQRVFVTEVLADQVAFLESKGGQNNQSSNQPNNNNAFSRAENPPKSEAEPIDISDEGLPF
ncbi:single-stranded DNA-binding protein A [Lentibacillus kapialis]|uniref:Single-stranded DNA-binding protein n=1 Tax=Lentibacillus kapialis TaxID=340214 RepID=A0A917PNM8_9BACI|nr:single-stranded DNA-binding protein [Lentibacillus kapialis]GGJ86152.1 single-stranded DNA-binding protein A [Lentibacillus kapialis]